jgi:hypothetical protein
MRLFSWIRPHGSETDTILLELIGIVLKLTEILSELTKFF